MRHILKKITDDVYGVDIYISIGIEYKKLLRPIKRRFNVRLDCDDVPPKCDGASISLSTGWLLWTRNHDFPIIAHEALHITQHILETHDVFLSKATKEVYAYYMGWILDNVKKHRGVK